MTIQTSTCCDHFNPVLVNVWISLYVSNTSVLSRTLVVSHYDSVVLDVCSLTWCIASHSNLGPILVENNHTRGGTLHQLRGREPPPWSASYSGWRSEITPDVPLLLILKTRGYRWAQHEVKKLNQLQHLPNQISSSTLPCWGVFSTITKEMAVKFLFKRKK